MLFSPSGGVIGGIAAGASAFVIITVALLLLWFHRRRRKLATPTQDALLTELGQNSDGGSSAGSSAHLTPFRVFDSVIEPPPVAPPPPQIPLPSSGPASPALTYASYTPSPPQSEPGPSLGPRLIVYNADGAVAESTSLTDVLEEKRRLAIRERDRHGPPPGFTPRLASRIRNSAGQLPPDYHLATQPPTSRPR